MASGETIWHDDRVGGRVDTGEMAEGSNDALSLPSDCMNPKAVAVRPRVIVAGFVAGLVAGWSPGCSRPSPPDVNVQQVKEALAKRRSDYGEPPRSRPRGSDRSPVQHRDR
jgi:hypothetical protein